MDLHTVALGERFDPGAVALARVDIGKVDGLDVHARKERGKAVGVVLVIVRQHHGVERRTRGAQIIRDGAGVDIGILAAAVHERRVALGNEQHALPLPHIERDDVQPAALIVQRVDLCCGKERCNRKSHCRKVAVLSPLCQRAGDEDGVHVDKPSNGKVLKYTAWNGSASKSPAMASTARMPSAGTKAQAAPSCGTAAAISTESNPSANTMLTSHRHKRLLKSDTMESVPK